MLDIVIGILTVVEVIVCLLLILLVLMQRPRQEGLGASFGDAAMTQLVGAQTTNVLQKGTVYLAVILFVLTLSLAVLTTRKQAGVQGKKVFEEQAATPVKAAPAAGGETKPTEPSKKEAATGAVKSDKAEAPKAPSNPSQKAATPGPDAAPKPAAEPDKAKTETAVNQSTAPAPSTPTPKVESAPAQPSSEGSKKP